MKPHIDYIKSIDKYVLRGIGQELYSNKRYILEKEMTKRKNKKQYKQLNIFDLSAE